MHIVFGMHVLVLLFRKGTYMELESTLATIGAVLPEALEQTISTVTIYIPENVSKVINHAYTYLPAELDLRSMALFILYFGISSLILGVLGRIALGRESSLNHALSSAIGILFLYAAAIVIYTFKPWNLESLLSPLPFVTFAGDYMIVLPITDTQLPALCEEILSLIILAFLVNLLGTLLPKGDSVPGWYFLRFLSVILSLVLHFGVSWAFHTYLPGVLAVYAPMILLVILGIMLFSGVIGLILGIFISALNPFLGAMYAFFFSSLVGKQVSKAVFSAALLCGVVYLMEACGFTVVSITAAALLSYIPLAAVLLILWFLIGRHL